MDKIHFSFFILTISRCCCCCCCCWYCCCCIFCGGCCHLFWRRIWSRTSCYIWKLKINVTDSKFESSDNSDTVKGIMTKVTLVTRREVMKIFANWGYTETLSEIQRSRIGTNMNMTYIRTNVILSILLTKSEINSSDLLMKSIESMFYFNVDKEIYYLNLIHLN